jgi:DNA-binding NarL/FixJ family response regulator
MKSVFIIEDQTLLKDLVARLIENNKTLKLTGSSPDGQEGLKRCLEILPDIIIIDIILPGLNGVEIVRRIKRERKETAILAFSGTPSKSIIQKLMKEGTEGFVEKTAELSELERAIELIASGQRYYSQKILDMLHNIMMNPHQGDNLSILSNREKEVLQLIAEGLSNKEIATKLSISIKTVDSHRSNLMEKLQINTAVGLTRFAIANGLTSVDKDNF